MEDAFICSGYRHLIHDCTMHHIPTVKIEAAILAVIQRVSWYVRHNEKEFIERVREASDQNQEKTVKECKQKINKAQKRAHQSQATKKSRQKMYEEAATRNPEAVERYENYLVTRRESYHRKKQEAERTA